MKVRIKRIDKSLPLPEYQTEGAVGFDIYSRFDADIKPKQYAALQTNLVVEVPHGYMLAMPSRSSTYRKMGLILPNAIAIFDQDFCGDNDEMIIQAYNLSEETVHVSRGDRLAQGIFVPVAIAEWDEVETMSKPDRGGIGTTGLK